MRRILAVLVLAACAPEPRPPAEPAPAETARDEDDSVIRLKGSARPDAAPVATRASANQARIDALAREARDSRGKARATGWSSYPWAKGKFLVSMPAKPEEKLSLDMNVVVAELDSPRRVYQAGWRMLEDFERQERPETLIDGRLQELVRRHSDARIATSRPVVVLGRPGREARIETPAATLSVKVLVTDDRLIELLVKTAPGEDATDDARRFFDSFRPAG